MKKLAHFIEDLFGFYRWHPKIALRYLPIVEYIHTHLVQPYSILDVGSNGLGIAPYLREEVVGLDVTFTPPIADTIIPVKASASAIPFTTDSFEGVVCMDTLEHIPPDIRQKVIYELLRVSNKVLCIGVPTGKKSEAQDKLLYDLFREKTGSDFPYLIEHVTYGLPSIEDISQMLTISAEKLNKKIKIAHFGNINLKLRLFLMKGWMSEGTLANIFFRKLLLLAIPLFRQMNNGDTYRTLYMVTIST